MSTVLFNTVPCPLAIGLPMGPEWIVIAALGLLIFGKRLPEVGRSLGKGIVEFKRGLKGVEEEVENAVDETPVERRIADQSDANGKEAKFDPYTGKPIKPEAKFDPYTGKPIGEEASQSDTHSA
jgi:sec-independent protein translocase protein TatA